MDFVLYLHIIVGALALVTGGVALSSEKGKSVHLKSGRIYVLAMTMVFVTGIAMASYTFNRFLFLIAFLSYYSVFCGVRVFLHLIMVIHTLIHITLHHFINIFIMKWLVVCTTVESDS